MSTISQLLRNSRLAHVVQSENPLFQTSKKIYPTHQVIETKPSTFYRQEWGLKSSIPSKIKTRYLVYNDLDTLERLTTFEPIGQYQWNRIRFQEMGLSPTYGKDKPNPLFQGSTSKNVGYAPLSTLMNLDRSNTCSENNQIISKIKTLRPEFKKWLLEKYGRELSTRILNPKLLNKYVHEFLSEKTSDLDLKDLKSPNWKIIGTGGLTYNLSGRLRQSPNGIKQITVVPGRIISSQGLDKSVAIGGFIANASSLGRNIRKMDNEMGDFIREHKLPFSVNDAKVSDDGKITLSVNLIEPRGEILNRFKKSIPMSSFRNHDRGKYSESKKSINSEESSMHAEELLSILTNFEK